MTKTQKQNFTGAVKVLEGAALKLVVGGQSVNNPGGNQTGSGSGPARTGRACTAAARCRRNT